mmetsp:Transcript_13306/g.24599  ORF Transcript_13306/g.24599 Transcript_13306/m.24599 type:complete len:227 (-) Transcript_13306:753-1433(-)
MELNDISPLIFTAILGLIVLVFLSYFLKKEGSTNSRNKILVCGPSGSGKTLFSYRLCLDKSPTTITSMKPSLLEFGPDRLSLVDFPGHPRLRTLLYTTYLEQTKEIIFLIDSSNVQNQAREAAEFLYDMFTNPLIDKVTKFRVVCNKSDLSNSRPHSRIKLSLQQELEKIKKTRKSLEEADDGTFVPLGREGKPFNFDQDAPVEIEFYSLSAMKDSVETITESLGL